MTRRAIYRCECRDNRCTVRTAGERPARCIYWKDYCNWVRFDKHEQTEIQDYVYGDMALRIISIDSEDD